ncbi:hypothetical protein HYH03_010525 [Edaphochlamys debaryana]|uniref:Uncharacterized protein n=1 Tax=Edaphochlamys debaryana TaxID=47281 RepID=A0A836BW47_9CHLO|nr:hypothetical protein HYH03_010525 [Edaphochlamys debaryana]|eukprot:KAG2491080.1 hypothetical protein HYH03_010525 [Edaphochlamys debaryana]
MLLTKRVAPVSSRQAALLPARPARSVRANLFRGRDPGPTTFADLEAEAPSREQRQRIKATLVDLGFTDQAAEILAYGKVTASNADLLIGDIRASFGIYSSQPAPSATESPLSGVSDWISRLRLPFTGLAIAAGLAALYANRESLGELFAFEVPTPESLSAGAINAVDGALDALESAGVDPSLLDAVDEALFNALQR